MRACTPMEQEISMGLCPFWRLGRAVSSIERRSHCRRQRMVAAFVELCRDSFQDTGQTGLLQGVEDMGADLGIAAALDPSPIVHVLLGATVAAVHRPMIHAQRSRRANHLLVAAGR